MGLNSTGPLTPGFFSNSKYYSTTQFAIGWIQRYRTRDKVEPRIWKFASDNVSILFVRVFLIFVSDRFNVRKMPAFYCVNLDHLINIYMSSIQSHCIWWILSFLAQNFSIPNCIRPSVSVKENNWPWNDKSVLEDCEVITIIKILTLELGLGLMLISDIVLKDF